MRSAAALVWTHCFIPVNFAFTTGGTRQPEAIGGACICFYILCNFECCECRWRCRCRWWCCCLLAVNIVIVIVGIQTIVIFISLFFCIFNRIEHCLSCEHRVVGSFQLAWHLNVHDEPRQQQQKNEYFKMKNDLVCDRCILPIRKVVYLLSTRTLCEMRFQVFLE